MNVGQLKIRLKDIPDNTPVMFPAFDHSFRHLDIVHTIPSERINGKYSEYFEGCEVPGSEIITIVVLD